MATPHDKGRTAPGTVITLLTARCYTWSVSVLWRPCPGAGQTQEAFRRGRRKKRFCRDLCRTRYHHALRRARLGQLQERLAEAEAVIEQAQAKTHGHARVPEGCQRRAKTAHLWRLKIAHLQTQVTSLRPSYPPSVRAVSMWLGRWFSAG